MPLSRRSLLAGSLGGVTGAALTACGSEVTGPVAGQSAAVPTEPTTLTWWCHRLTDRRNGELAPLLTAAFERRHPQIRVRRLKAPSDTDTNRAALTTQIASGSPSTDVFPGDVARPGQFAYNSLALPLDPYVPQGHGKKYPKPLIDACSAEGGVYALPFFIDESPVWERTGHRRKGRDGCRVPLPWTVEGPAFGFSTGTPWLPQPETFGGYSRGGFVGPRGGARLCCTGASRGHPAPRASRSYDGPTTDT